MSLIKNLGLELQKTYTNILNKLNSIKGTKESISKGFATGVAMSFTPFVGFHILLSLIVTKFTKQNAISATLGTIAGNPWTFPFIWYLVLHTGNFILGRTYFLKSDELKVFFSQLFHAIINLDFILFLNDIWPIFLPMLIGCIPYYVLVWLFVSKVVFKAISSKATQK